MHHNYVTLTVIYITEACTSVTCQGDLPYMYSWLLNDCLYHNHKTHDRKKPGCNQCDVHMFGHTLNCQSKVRMKLIKPNISRFGLLVLLVFADQVEDVALGA